MENGKVKKQKMHAGSSSNRSTQKHTFKSDQKKGKNNYQYDIQIVREKTK